GNANFIPDLRVQVILDQNGQVQRLYDAQVLLTVVSLICCVGGECGRHRQHKHSSKRGYSSVKHGLSPQISPKHPNSVHSFRCRIFSERWPNCYLNRTPKPATRTPETE